MKIFSIFFLTLTQAFAAPSSLTPEQRIAELAKNLKPIPESTWKEIAGSRLQESYEIVQGDTLSDISGRLFGDSKYWPKLWAINHGSILNPHEIVPGVKIAFLSGSGVSLPQLNIENGNTQEPTPLRPSKKRRSKEWSGLPRQRWEMVQLLLPPGVDVDGFDKNSRVKVRVRPGFDLEAFATDAPIEPLGKVVAGKSEGTFVSNGDVVFIQGDEELQVGETYALTKDPSLLKSRLSDRIGYSYLVLGLVKIIGVRDGLYIGTLKNGKEPTFRGAHVIPNPKRAGTEELIPATESTQGILLFNRDLGSFATAQHKTVFIDRGSEDGVKPGMVFRAFEHYDPATDKRITDSDFIVAADMKVTHVSEHFCTAYVVSSVNVVHENQTVALLTDVSELIRDKKYQAISPEERSRDNELDRLDSLDNSGLGTDEKKELKQLEEWKNNPEAIPPTVNSAPADPGAATSEPTEPPPPPPPPSDAPVDATNTAPAAPEPLAPTAPAPSMDSAPPPPPPPPPAEDSAEGMEDLLNQ